MKDPVDIYASVRGPDEAPDWFRVGSATSRGAGWIMGYALSALPGEGGSYPASQMREKNRVLHTWYRPVVQEVPENTPEELEYGSYQMKAEEVRRC